MSAKSPWNTHAVVGIFYPCPFFAAEITIVSPLPPLNNAACQPLIKELGWKTIDQLITSETNIPGGYSLPFYTGGPCQQFISEPQILSHSFEEPQILSLRILRP